MNMGCMGTIASIDMIEAVKRGREGEREGVVYILILTLILALTLTLT